MQLLGLVKSHSKLPVDLRRSHLQLLMLALSLFCVAVILVVMQPLNPDRPAENGPISATRAASLADVATKGDATPLVRLD
ncbi:hypothetical protein E4Z66_06420 [Aliishimia ponticola]|uniref:Uncharacterized protein n=1 Tax=Aliishimia ponticola TaxID=2499833 RepID=A0A4S4NB44_9RHOB|nr:hypothetical protein [Aliishimia ponticola]THH36582.1 hypothetical protein E4Z66_06420 [Aliishimia ponticola]